MSQSVIVGGDFRTLLNALSHIDEVTLARFLPFRVGRRGLHLIEAVGLAVAGLSDLQRESLARRGAQPTPTLAARVAELTRYFAMERAELERNLQAGVPLSREIMVLGDPAREALVATLLQPHLDVPVTAAEPEKRKGWFARLFGG